MRISRENYRRYIRANSTVATPAAVPPIVGASMNSTEARYVREVLEPSRLAGEIREYRFQVEGLRLADNLFYYPDFRVIEADWRVVFHEVKGGFVREDAWVKFKIAVQEHPYPFVLARWEKGNWAIELHVREDR